MQAFEYAVDLGYRYLETDVQVTADGVLVAFHDNDLQRTCGRPGKISELPWSEVSTALVDGKAPIPLLEELLGAWPEVRVNIDCKSNAACRRAGRVAASHQLVARVCVAAFSDLRMRRLRKAPGRRAVQRARADRAGTAALRPPAQATRAGRAGAGQAGPADRGQSGIRRAVPPAGFAGPRVDDRRRAEMERLLDLGVDGIMTDRPAILREVLESRGQWHT